MAFTYTGDLSNPLELVRFLIHDTDETMPVFQDGEIQYFIDEYDNPTKQDLMKVAALLLRNKIRQIALSPARERAGQIEVYNASAEALKTVLSDINDQIKANSTPQPMFGGVYKEQVRRNRQNTSLVDSVWERDQFEEHDDDCGFYPT